MTDEFDPCGGPLGEKGPIWPPANFEKECWPSTRYGSLIFLGVSIVLWCIPQMWPKYRECILWNVFGGPFFFGLWIGFAAHFIPCIWWTCDWGYYDGKAIRGGIWFGVWAGVTAGLAAWVCKKNNEEKA